MVSGSEGHLRIYGNVETCALEAFVEGCLDGAFVVHYYRIELAFPEGVPVGRRDEVGRMLYLEAIAFRTCQYDLQCLCVIKVFLDIALQVRVFAAE